MKVKRIKNNVQRANSSQDAIVLMTCSDHKLLTNFGRGWKIWDQVQESTWGPQTLAKSKLHTMLSSQIKLMLGLVVVMRNHLKEIERAR